MLRFCANLTTMYGHMPLFDAMAAARADGFEAVECRTPFDFPPELVRERLDGLGLEMVQFNCPMGNFAAGDRGLTCVPGREEEYRASIQRTIAYANALNVAQVNSVGGVIPPGATEEEAEAVMVANLRDAAPRLADAGIRLQIEPINPVDNPGIFLSSLERFVRVRDRVAHDNLFLQYDFYHVQISDGSVIENYRRFAPVISHVQVADTPVRHEPGTGEMDYDGIFQALRQTGYQGWVGCEYVPQSTARNGLGWMERSRAG